MTPEKIAKAVEEYLRVQAIAAPLSEEDRTGLRAVIAEAVAPLYASIGPKNIAHLVGAAMVKDPSYSEVIDVAREYNELVKSGGLYSEPERVGARTLLGAYLASIAYTEFPEIIGDDGVVRDDLVDAVLLRLELRESK